MWSSRLASRIGIGARRLLVLCLFASAPLSGTSSAQTRSTDHTKGTGVYTAVPQRLTSLPSSYRVVEHRNATRHGGADTRDALAGEEKVIYANTGGQVLFRPGVGNRVADDLVTTLVAPCALDEITIRVSGGVEGGGGVFSAELRLYDGCPDFYADGEPIPGTLTLFTELDDDSAVLHDLILDFRDRGICDDGSYCRVSAQDCGDTSDCVANPVVIPTEVWIRIRFNTDDARIVVGLPPETGFSSDGYDDVFGGCTNFFGGWPTFSHASFWVTMVAPQECETNFLAYQAGGERICNVEPIPQSYQGARLADDITLTVPECELDAFEFAVRATGEGPFELELDLRYDEDTVIPETHTILQWFDHFEFRVFHVKVPPQVSINIHESDQPLLFTWALLEGSEAGVIIAERALAGSSSPFLSAPEFGSPTTDPAFEPLGCPGVAQVRIFCRGEPPLGACCASEEAETEEICINDLAVSDCLGQPWALNSVCDTDPFHVPCGMHACCLPGGSCEDLLQDECESVCDDQAPSISCDSDADCPNGRWCLTAFTPGVCSPPCGLWMDDRFCDDPCTVCEPSCTFSDLSAAMFGAVPMVTGPDCAIDATVYSSPYLERRGLDRLHLDFACNPDVWPCTFFDFELFNPAIPEQVGPVSSVIDPIESRVTVFVLRWFPWTCIRHVDSGRAWCVGTLPGDVNQDRLVNTADILALIDSINGVPGRVLPLYATDINRNGEINTSDIRRLIDLMNGVNGVGPWLSRSLPPCPTAE